MKATIIRYLNEIVSLTVLALMAVALVAGQADATVHGVGNDFDATVLRAELAIQLDLGKLEQLNMNEESVEVIREVIRDVIESRLEGQN